MRPGSKKGDPTKHMQLPEPSGVTVYFNVNVRSLNSIFSFDKPRISLNK